MADCTHFVQRLSLQSTRYFSFHLAFRMLHLIKLCSSEFHMFRWPLTCSVLASERVWGTVHLKKVHPGEWIVIPGAFLFFVAPVS